jgi:transposase
MKMGIEMRADHANDSIRYSAGRGTELGICLVVRFNSATQPDVVGVLRTNHCRHISVIGGVEHARQLFQTVAPTPPDCGIHNQKGGIMPKEMEVVIPTCCGIDIHKEVAVCCLRKTVGESVTSEVRSFSTMTEGLRALKEWLIHAGVTHVAVESTGVYWKPLFNILEDSMTVVLANARHVKHVPGRKTDVKDCEWLAKLLQCGLIQGSFIPPKWNRELRDLTRYRRKIMGHLASEKNRVQKVLEDANIKLSSVATDVFGVSGMLILKALSEGDTDGESLAKLAQGRLKEKIPELEKALTGHVSSHHLFMIKRSLEHIAYIQKSVRQVDREIEKKLKPYGEDYQRLQGIPGVKETGAASIIAEIGTDMSIFPTVQHLTSWAGICPGNNESAGKKKVESPDPEICG